MPDASGRSKVRYMSLSRLKRVESVCLGRLLALQENHVDIEKIYANKLTLSRPDLDSAHLKPAITDA